MQQASHLRRSQGGCQGGLYLGDHFSKGQSGNRVSTESLSKRPVVFPNSSVTRQSGNGSDIGETIFAGRISDGTYESLGPFRARQFAKGLPGQPTTPNLVVYDRIELRGWIETALPALAADDQNPRFVAFPWMVTNNIDIPDCG